MQITVAFSEIALRSARLKRGQNVAKRTAASIGPIVAKNVENADNAVLNISI
jgi:hypothetical protein